MYEVSIQRWKAWGGREVVDAGLGIHTVDRSRRLSKYVHTSSYLFMMLTSIRALIVRLPHTTSGCWGIDGNIDVTANYSNERLHCAQME